MEPNECIAEILRELADKFDEGTARGVRIGYEIGPVGECEFTINFIDNDYLILGMARMGE